MDKMGLLIKIFLKIRVERKFDSSESTMKQMFWDMEKSKSGQIN